MNQRIWTNQEDEYIKEYFGKVTYSEMANHLHCTIKTVQNRAELLGCHVERKKQKRWTKEEMEFLQSMAPKELNTTIANHLNRSVTEVNKKARSLGIKLNRQSPTIEEWKMEFLKENLNKISLSKISKQLNMNYYQLMALIQELGLTYQSNRWTPEEEQTLIELSSKYYIRELAKVLNKTEGAIITKASKMGLQYITLNRKYTPEELEFIRKNWGTIPVTDMARTLKVSRIMIQRQADLMNLPKLGRNKGHKWSDEKIEKLRRLAKKKTITELAKYFKTTNEAIQTMASRNGINLIDEKVHWSEEDNQQLREYAKTMDVNEIAKKMNRNASAVRIQAQRQGIVIQKNKVYQESQWTNENSEELKQLVLQGKTLIEITKAMKKKDQTILLKAKEMGLTIPKDVVRPWTEEEKQKLIELSKTKTLSELVRELERSSGTIRYQAKKLGIVIKSDRKKWTPEEYKQLEQLMTEKASPTEIARKLGRTEEAIIVKINRCGLKIQTNDKRFWTSEEETILSDLWGNESIERIAKKLNRTVSSIRNKAGLLGLGSQKESNYDGLKIREICDLFNVKPEVVSIYWVALGLKWKTRNITQSTSYRYVAIKDLYDFLEKNQNIWDSRSLEKNILGKEPKWLQEKRVSDRNMPLNSFGLKNLTKQQLIIAQQFFLENEEPFEQSASMSMKLKRKW